MLLLQNASSLKKDRINLIVFPFGDCLNLVNRLQFLSLDILEFFIYHSPCGFFHFEEVERAFLFEFENNDAVVEICDEIFEGGNLLFDVVCQSRPEVLNLLILFRWWKIKDFLFHLGESIVHMTHLWFLLFRRFDWVVFYINGVIIDLCDTLFDLCCIFKTIINFEMVVKII